MEADQSLDSGESYFHRDANNWNVQVRPASHTFRHVDDLITLLIRFEQLAGTNLQHSFWTSLNSELSFYWYGGLGVLLSLVTFFFMSLFSLRYINVAMVTILKNMTNILTAIGEIYIFRKGQNKKVWAALFLMVCPRAIPVWNAFCSTFAR
jgi:hypothetical protein